MCGGSASSQPSLKRSDGRSLQRKEGWMSSQSTSVAHQDAPGTQRRLDFTPTASELQHEAQRRDNACWAILNRLERGPASTAELFSIGGSGTSSRIAELRKSGFQIPPPEKHGRIWYYKLVEP